MQGTSASGRSTWLVVGASRGIGRELVRQLLEQGNRVLASVRSDATAAQFWPDVEGVDERCQLSKCDMLDDSSIDVRHLEDIFLCFWKKIDNVVEICLKSRRIGCWSHRSCCSKCRSIEVSKCKSASLKSYYLLLMKIDR